VIFFIGFPNRCVILVCITILYPACSNPKPSPPAPENNEIRRSGFWGVIVHGIASLLLSIGFR
jgi:hypothetical protein